MPITSLDDQLCLAGFVTSNKPLRKQLLEYLMSKESRFAECWNKKKHWVDYLHLRSVLNKMNALKMAHMLLTPAHKKNKFCITWAGALKKPDPFLEAGRRWTTMIPNVKICLTLQSYWLVRHQVLLVIVWCALSGQIHYMCFCQELL